MSQARRILSGSHKHRRFLVFDVEGTGSGINSEADPLGITDRARTEGGGGWGMGPLGRGVFPRFSRSRRLAYS